MEISFGSRRLLAARRRAVLRLAVAVLVAALWWAVRAPSGAAQPSPAAGDAAPPVTVVVGPGDTVWDLAGPHVPDGVDRAVYVARVTAANGVDGRALTPGSVLRLPQR